MTTENPDTDTILSDPGELKLASGLEIKVERLKTRATLALLRIIMGGAEDIFRLGLNPQDEEFQSQLIMSVLFAIPNAPEETIGFLRLMVKPAHLREEGRISKGDEAWNEDLWTQLDKELLDPEVEDLIDITVAIVTAEAPHLQALEKIAALIPTITRQLQTSKDESTPRKPSSKRVSKASTQTAS